MSAMPDRQNNISERQRRRFNLAVGLIVVALLGDLILLGGFVYPRWRRRQEVNALLSRARVQLETMRLEYEHRTPEEVQADIEAARAELAEQAAVLLSEEEAAETLNRLYRHADETGVNILSIESDIDLGEDASVPAVTSTLYTVRFFHLEARAPTDSLLDFLGKIEETARVGFSVTNVTLDATSSPASLALDVILYTASDELRSPSE